MNEQARVSKARGTRFGDPVPGPASLQHSPGETPERLCGVDEQYERMRAALLAALAEHERGRFDNAGLQAAIEGLRGTLDNGHADVEQALFEADVALEYAEDGRPGGGTDQRASLRRMRRNLREVLG